MQNEINSLNFVLESLFDSISDPHEYIDSIQMDRAVFNLEQGIRFLDRRGFSLAKKYFIIAKRIFDKMYKELDELESNGLDRLNMSLYESFFGPFRLLSLINNKYLRNEGKTTIALSEIQKIYSSFKMHSAIFNSDQNRSKNLILGLLTKFTSSYTLKSKINSSRKHNETQIFFLYLLQEYSKTCDELIQKCNSQFETLL